jgi:hypothetical protein
MYDNLHVEVDLILSENQKWNVSTSMTILANLLLRNERMIDLFCRERDDGNERNDSIQKQLLYGSTSFGTSIVRRTQLMYHQESIVYCYKNLTYNWQGLKKNFRRKSLQQLTLGFHSCSQFAAATTTTTDGVTKLLATATMNETTKRN